MKTTKRHGTDFGFLKTIIVMGSLMATLIGGNLLTKQTNPINDMTEPAKQSTTMNTNINLGDAPIARLIIPKPVTNSRSSQ